MRWTGNRRTLIGGGLAVGAGGLWLGRQTDVLGADPFGASPADVGASGSRILRHPVSALAQPRPWLNAAAPGAAGLVGQVLLVNFWTYSCINSLRPLPYLRRWAEQFSDRGLKVIGVHTPEFAFERDPVNVRRAITALDVGYPVVLDPDYEIWRAFGNGGWPGFALVGADGHVRRRSLGEGAYDQMERQLDALLAEPARNDRSSDGARQPAGLQAAGIQAAPDWTNLKSPETYVGYARANALASSGGARRNRPHDYTAPGSLSRDRWSLAGRWNVGPEFAALEAPGGRIRHRFHARDLHLVLGAADAAAPIRFRVTLDGRGPGASHGVDTDSGGWGTLAEPRLYQLIRQTGPIEDRTFEIEFQTRGARAYAFTFG